MKQLVRAAKSEKSNHIADIKFDIIDDDMKKKYPWLQGGGSLLDFIDSANPGVVARIFGGVTGMDALFEKFPTIFRKGAMGSWESKDGNLDVSGERGCCGGATRPSSAPSSAPRRARPRSRAPSAAPST
ncbi:MAG: hypothetical protein R3F43_09620 [bacterium]